MAGGIKSNRHLTKSRRDSSEIGAASIKRKTNVSDKGKTIAVASTTSGANEKVNSVSSCGCYSNGLQETNSSFSLCFHGHVIPVSTLRSQQHFGGAGVVIHSLDLSIFWEGSRYLGNDVNPIVADCEALLDGLKIVSFFGATKLYIRGSSTILLSELESGFDVSTKSGNKLAGLQRQAKELAGTMEIVVNETSGICYDKAVALSMKAADLKAAAQTDDAFDDAIGRGKYTKSAVDVSMSSGGSLKVSSIEKGKSVSNHEVPKLSPFSLKGESGKKLKIDKGKAPIREDTNGKSATCAICLAQIPRGSMFTVSKCSHPFCRSCLSTYAEIKVKERQPQLMCPIPGCKTIFSTSDSQALLPPGSFDMHLQHQAEASIPEDEKIHCPFQDCSALMLAASNSWQNSSSSRSPRMDNIYVIKQAECLECHRLFCANCRVPWHADMDCEEFVAISADHGQDLDFNKLAGIKKWKRCSKCLRMIERAAGCWHMTCRCGHEFCYRCRSPWLQKKPTCKCRDFDESSDDDTDDDSDDASDDDREVESDDDSEDDSDDDSDDD